MSTFNHGVVRPFESGAALERYRFVKETAENVVSPATAGTDKITGVTDGEASAAGEGVAVVLTGTALVEASAAISLGAYVTATAGGKAVATTTTGHIVRGRALQAAGADGDLIEIELLYFVHA